METYILIKQEDLPVLGIDWSSSIMEEMMEERTNYNKGNKMERKYAFIVENINGKEIKTVNSWKEVIDNLGKSALYMRDINNKSLLSGIIDADKEVITYENKHNVTLVSNPRVPLKDEIEFIKSLNKEHTTNYTIDPLDIHRMLQNFNKINPLGMSSMTSKIISNIEFERAKNLDPTKEIKWNIDTTKAREPKGMEGVKMKGNKKTVEEVLRFDKNLNPIYKDNAEDDTEKTNNNRSNNLINYTYGLLLLDTDEEFEIVAYKNSINLHYKDYTVVVIINKLDTTIYLSSKDGEEAVLEDITSMPTNTFINEIEIIETLTDDVYIDMLFNLCREIKDEL